MKTKKAIKKLENVEALLSDVIEQFTGIDPGAQELLRAARKIVVGAKDKVTRSTKPKSGAKKTTARKTPPTKQTPAGKRKPATKNTPVSGKKIVRSVAEAVKPA
jgi:hypothetical protein